MLISLKKTRNALSRFGFDKTKFILMIILFASIFVSCNTGKNEKLISDSQTKSDNVSLEPCLEIDIISQTLHRLIFSTSRPPIVTDEEFLDLINDDNSIVKRFAVSDTIKLVFVFDTLYGITNLKGKDEFLGISTFLDEEINIDSISNMEINPNRLQIKYYEIAKTPPPEDDCNYRDYGYKGKVILSRILFNKSKTKAFFYFNFYCGCMCGFGKAVFVENINGSWQIIKITDTWIS